MERFFEKGLTVSKLLEIYQKSVAEGYGDAVVEVQADADHISDIIVNGVEGWGNELNRDGPKVLSLVSASDKQQFENFYGKAD
jgi:hypothetical protein